MTPRNPSRKAPRASLRWPVVLDRAREIVGAYAGRMTLRQLFYRLVAEGVIPNDRSAYSKLSDRTAEARRAGTFPALVDRTRATVAPRTFEDPADARAWLSTVYRLDRTEGQDRQVVLGVEKDTLAALVSGWFEAEGLPVVVLRGYGSQTYLDDVADLIADDPRPTVLVYAGDLDPSGEDIVRDLRERVPAVGEPIRVAVTLDTVADFGLPELPGKAKDPRAPAFIARHGRLFQVEVEALDPNDLEALFREAVAPFVDTTTLARVTAREAAERASLRGAR